jgi:hypothetical protein
MPTNEQIREQGIAEAREFDERQSQEASRHLTQTQLQADRGHTSREVVFQVGEWQHRTNVVDFGSFDSRRGHLTNLARRSIEDVVDDPLEAKRILGYIKNYHGKIKDYQSFKDAFKTEFNKGGSKSGSKLWQIMGDDDALLLKLFAHTETQDKVTRDRAEEDIPELMRVHRINSEKAKSLYQAIRIQERGLIQRGLLPVSQRASTEINQAIFVPTPTLARGGIRQAARSGTVYTRNRPQPFIDIQIRFLRNNPQLKPKEMTERFNLVFGTQRTVSSVSTKMGRLRRESQQ